ncbi:MAG: hypothetical protein PUB49_02830 [Selenomonadaceae bacterium]|nr:hypothetical protein [Selenomonadaceae bacterium]
MAVFHCEFFGKLAGTESGVSFAGRSAFAAAAGGDGNADARSYSRGCRNC